MAIINAIQLKNLRCLDNTGFINIKPITVLVGKNSAGKSTFARTLPLLRQSAEEDKRAPILWYGRLVDFGDFKTAINRNNKSGEIGFAFKLSLKKPVVPHYYWNSSVNSDRWEATIGRDTEIMVALNLSLDIATNSTFASSIDIELFGNKCNLKFSNSTSLSEININNLKWLPTESVRCVVSQNKILPGINFYRAITRKVDTEEKRFFVKTAPFNQAITSKLSTLAHANTKQETLINIAKGINLDSIKNMLSSLQKSPFAPYTFQLALSELTVRSPIVKEINDLLIATAIPNLLELIDESLAEVINGVRYIEPLRATAQRYYRRQELAVDEIDSKGTNVAMYIDSLSIQEKDKINLWLKEYFGIELAAKSDGGHVALTLKQEGSNQATNFADLGVGFSQIIPFVLQLWQAANPNFRKNRAGRGFKQTCLVIEQPELHLHPAYQAKIADVMLAAISNAKTNDRQLSIIAETHSPHLINRLGELVSLGLLQADDVQIVIFEDSEELDCAKVKTSFFDDNGVLINWPYGFFEPI